MPSCPLTRRFTPRASPIALTVVLRMLGLVLFVFIAGDSSARADASASGLVLSVEDDRIPAGALRDALARELGIAIEVQHESISSRPILRIAPLASGQVKVTLERPNMPRFERTTELPEQASERLEVVTLLAENLIRNEAEGLLLSLGEAAPSPVTETLSIPTEDLPKPESAPTAPYGSACSERITTWAAVDLLPAVGVGSTTKARDAVRGFSFGVFGAYMRGVRGLSLSAFVNIQRDSMCGMQTSGAANVVVGSSQGFQLALANYVGRASSGVSLGLLNYTGGTQRGFLLGLANVVLDDQAGLGLGLVNFTHGTFQGASLSLVNIATSHTRGAQLGLVNASGKDLHGLQLGLLNLSAKNATGLQLGLLNVAGGEAHGLQLGLVNVAAKSQVPVGMVSIVRKGRTDLDLWGPNETGILLAGVRHGGTRVHNLYYAGTRVGSAGSRAAMALGIGIRALETKRLRLDIDAVSQFLYRVHADTPSYQQALRVPLTIMVTSMLGVVVAPSYQFYFSSDRNERSQARFGVTAHKTSGALRIESFPGASVGLRIELPSGAVRAR